MKRIKNNAGIIGQNKIDTNLIMPQNMYCETNLSSLKYALTIQC